MSPIARYRLQALSRAIDRGETLTNPETWAKRASAISAVSAALTATVALAGALGHPLGLSNSDIDAIAILVGTVGALVANLIHVASNPHAGPKR